MKVQVGDKLTIRTMGGKVVLEVAGENGHSITILAEQKENSIGCNLSIEVVTKKGTFD